MQILAGVTYLLFLAYVANFLMLSAVAARQAGRSVWLFGAGMPRQRIVGWAFRVAFIGAMLWPPVRIWTGGFSSDPLTSAFQGTASALLGHLLVAAGAAVAQLLLSAAAITAAVAQVQIEERVLAKTYGQAYADYVARVPRWLGRSRAPPPHQG